MTQGVRECHVRSSAKLASVSESKQALAPKTQVRPIKIVRLWTDPGYFVAIVRDFGQHDILGLEVGVR